MSKSKVLNSPDVAEPVGPYSHAVSAGGFLFCTGQLPLDPDGKMVVGSPADQARQCLQNLEAVCATAGISLADVVRVGIFMTDLSQFAAVNEVYAAALPHRPARTTVEVSALPMGATVEMDAIALLG